MRRTYTYTDFLTYSMRVIKNIHTYTNENKRIKKLRNRLLKKIDISYNLSRFNKAA